MSVDATRATWKLSKKITAIQKLLLLALADRAGENGECWPGISRLIADTNLDRHTIVDNRKILIQKGYIELTGELKGRTKSIPVMRLTYVKNREGIFTENQEFLSNGESNTAIKSSSVEMPTGSSVESNTAKQCGNAHLEPKRIEPIKEPITSFSYPDTLYQSTETSILLYEKKQSDESFDLFYKIYPIQKNENRARNAWLAQRCWERFEEIITALNALILHDAHFKDGYAPNPDKWILEEKWKDKPVKRKSRNSSQAYTVEDSSHSTWGNSKKGLI